MGAPEQTPQGFTITFEASAEVIPGDPPETEENDR